MSRIKQLAVLGGDQRQISMARRLAEHGYKVRVWGLGKCRETIGNAVLSDTWETALAGSDAVILPLPASADGVRVHCPLHDHDVFLRITTLLDTMGRGSLLLGGRLTEPIRSIAEQKGTPWIDYYESEVLQLKNALPTAEGAIALAMQELPITLDGCEAAILGYGRIGALLGEKLQALGAHVTVYARRPEALTLAQLHRHATKRLVCREGRTVPESFSQDLRVVFNTVPHRLMERRELLQIPQNCVLIDLASAPGGFDHAVAAELGLRIVWGMALPGKCVPESAGLILADTLAGILDEYDRSRVEGGI